MVRKALFGIAASLMTLGAFSGTLAVLDGNIERTAPQGLVA